MVKYLNSLNKITIIIIGFFMVIVLGMLDLITGTEFSFAIFYLIPISFTTWYCNRRYGIFFSILSSIAWLNADFQFIERYSTPTAPYWNALVRLGFFLIVVVLIGQLKKSESELERKVEEKTTDLMKEIEERKKAESDLHMKSIKLGELTNKILILQDEQNFHLAREIHDELGQAMTAIKIDLMWLSKRFSINPDLVESLYSITQTVDETIVNIRQISHNLRPRLLDELGFIPAVERYLKDYKSKTGVDYIFQFDKEKYQLDLHEKNSLFRIFQEALTNITRHSQASLVNVNIISCEAYILDMSIIDNGKGLPKDYKSKLNSLGILGMEERAEGIGGIFSISSAEGEGTTVRIKLKEKIKNG